MKRTMALLSPLLLFLILAIPYWCINSAFLVHWLGCGCLQADPVTGEIVKNAFGANDFTSCFCGLTAVCAAVLSALLTRFLPTGKKLRKALYVGAMLCASLIVAFGLTKVMMWN